MKMYNALRFSNVKVNICAEDNTYYFISILTSYLLSAKRDQIFRGENLF